MLDNHSILLRNLTTSELRRVNDQLKIRILDKQEYLCTQISSTDEVFTIASGSAAMERISSNGHRQVMAFLVPGDFIGLSGDFLYDFGVKSLTDLTAHEFKREQLFGLAEDIPTLKDNLKNIQSIVRSQMLQHLYLLGQKKAHDRVCYLLTYLLRRLPGATPEKIELPMTRQDIADYLGLTGETVSRTLTKLKQDGLISIPSANTIAILDLPAIETLGNVD